MDPRVAQLCADALGFAPEDVAELHDQAELLPALLAAQILSGRPRPDPAATNLHRAILHHYGDMPFQASTLLDHATQSHLTRPLLLALRAACNTGDCNPTEHQIGMKLGKLVKAPGSGFVRGHGQRNTGEWRCVELGSASSTE